MDTEARLEAITDVYSEQVADIPLDDAIDITETLITDLQKRLDALRDDEARASR